MQDDSLPAEWPSQDLSATDDGEPGAVSGLLWRQSSSSAECADTLSVLRSSTWTQPMMISRFRSYTTAKLSHLVLQQLVI